MFTVCSVHDTSQIQINIEYFESIFVQETTRTCIESTLLKTQTATATTTNNNEIKNFSKTFEKCRQYSFSLAVNYGKLSSVYFYQYLSISKY